MRRTSWGQKYDRYIKSEAWREKRGEFFASGRPKVCQGCGWSRHIHLHHKTYDRLGDEDLDDLVPVCEGCHSLIHRYHRERSGKVSLLEATDYVLGRIRSGKGKWAEMSARNAKKAAKSAQTSQKDLSVQTLVHSVKKKRYERRKSELLVDLVVGAMEKVSDPAWNKCNDGYVRVRDARRQYETTFTPPPTRRPSARSGPVMVRRIGDPVESARPMMLRDTQ